MAIVIDASVAIAWCLRDREGTAQADAVMDRASTEAVIVPGLFWHEIRSVLVVAERKERVEADAAEYHIERLRTLRFVTDDNQNDRQTVALARRHGLSGYDAAYLETAKRRGAKLATLDKKLAAAAGEEGVSIDGD
jgi:predicted nucleic acid-binding protein